MSLSSFRAPVDQVDPFRRFIARRLWSRESPVSGRNSAKSPLTPLELTGTPLLDSLHGVFGVLASSWAVPHYFPRHLYHTPILQRLRGEPPMARI